MPTEKLIGVPPPFMPPEWINKMMEKMYGPNPELEAAFRVSELRRSCGITSPPNDQVKFYRDPKIT